MRLLTGWLDLTTGLLFEGRRVARIFAADLAPAVLDAWRSKGTKYAEDSPHATGQMFHGPGVSRKPLAGTGRA